MVEANFYLISTKAACALSPKSPNRVGYVFCSMAVNVLTVRPKAKTKRRYPSHKPKKTADAQCPGVFIPKIVPPCPTGHRKFQITSDPTFIWEVDPINDVFEIVHGVLHEEEL